jgi:adenylate cyclase class 2
MTETEIKLRWNGSASEAQTLIERQGYRPTSPRTIEIDQLFDRAGGELQKSGLVLRLRRSGDHATVTYKGPAAQSIYKSREEIEFDVSDTNAFEAVLDRLGYQPGFRYEKYRTKFSEPVSDPEQQPGLVTIDETPVGIFLELEGPADWIDRTAHRLGFARTEYLTESYASLYRLHRAQHPNAPANMTFGLEGL